MSPKTTRTAALLAGIVLILALAVSAAAAPALPIAGDTVDSPEELIPIGYNFTYQGRLMRNGSPASGAFDFQFVLYDSEEGGSQVGTVTEEKGDVMVRNGMFTVLLNFGNVFNGLVRFIEVRVRPGISSGDYVVLSPRHPTWAKPYALFSGDAGKLKDHPVEDFQLRVGSSCAVGSAIRAIAADGTVTCETSVGSAWELSGNGGTTASNFLGTTDNMTLMLKANNVAGLRIVPNGTSVPNIIGGYETNSVTPGVNAATIAGGGSTTAGYHNLVTDNHGTVGGGWGNLAGNDSGTTSDATAATVVGGFYNRALGQYSFIGGGAGNEVSGYEGTIAGGDGNQVTASFGTVPGGMFAVASHHGELAYSSGGFSSEPGNAQTSTYVAMENTQGAQSRGLTLGISGGRITIAEDRAVAFDIQVVARSETGQSAAYHIEGLIENDAGTVQFVGTPTVTVLGEDSAAWDAIVRVYSGALEVYATGETGMDIYWVATVRTTEVQIPD